MSDYSDARLELHALMDEAARVIRRFHGAERDRLWAAATDDLADGVGTVDPQVLREAFTDVARDFWLRENELHSMRVLRPALRLVSEQEFEQMAYPSGRDEQ